jgi:hypothetical protein
MRLAERLVGALLIVIVDAAAFALPLAALVLAYVLLARPRWFRDWVEQLCRLCRMRHKRHYSACRIMPNLGVSAGEALAW